MADKILRYVITGKDNGAGAALKGVGDHAESVGHRIGGAFTQAGSKIGGELGEVLNSVGEGFEKLGEKGTSKLAKLGAAGAGLAAVGGVLTAMGDKEKQASQQLDQAIENTGHSAEEFKTQIEETVHHMERYGDSAIQTKTALQTLTQATHDPTKAIDLMGVAADLAAAKHMSLEDASSQLAKGLNGSTRVFKQFGVVVKTNADGTKDYTGAVAALANVVHGQANAAADTFTGKLKALRTEVTDNVAAFGEKFGPMITATGVGFIALAPLLSVAGKGIRAVASGFRTTGVAAEQSAAAVATADAEIVAGNEAAAASAGQLGAAQGRSRLAAIGMAGGFVTVAAFAYLGSRALANHIEKNNALAYSMDHLKGDLGDLTTAFVNNAGHTDEAGQEWLKGELASDGLANKAAKAGITVDQMSTAIAGGKDSTAALIEQWKKSGKPSDATIVALMSLTGGYTATADAASKASAETEVATAKESAHANAMGVSNGALKAANSAQHSATLSLKAQTLAMQVANDAAGLLAQGFDKLNGKTLGAEQANIAFRDSESAVMASVKQNGKSLSINTEQGRANRSAVLASITAAQAHAEAVGKQTGSTQKATQAFRGDISALRAHLTALGLQPAAIQAIISKYGKMPKVKMTQVELRDLASAKAAAIQRRIDAIESKTVTLTLHEVTTGRTGSNTGKQFTAGGSDFFPGGRTSLDERHGDPEAIVPRGYQIVPASKQGHGKGGDTYYIQVTSPQVWGGDEQALARHIAGMFKRTGVKLPASSVR